MRRQRVHHERAVEGERRWVSSGTHLGEVRRDRGDGEERAESEMMESRGRRRGGFSSFVVGVVLVVVRDGDLVRVARGFGAAMGLNPKARRRAASSTSRSRRQATVRVPTKAATWASTSCCARQICPGEGRPGAGPRRRAGRGATPRATRTRARRPPGNSRSGPRARARPPPRRTHARARPSVPEARAVARAAGDAPTLAAFGSPPPLRARRRGQRTPRPEAR